MTESLTKDTNPKNGLIEQTEVEEERDETADYNLKLKKEEFK